MITNMYTYEIKLQNMAVERGAEWHQAMRALIEKRISQLLTDCTRTGLYNLIYRYYRINLRRSGAKVEGLINVIIDAEYFMDWSGVE